MIEIPRAALMAHELAEVADFFSFGTNDLTQMTFGYSRDDAGVFLPEYVRQGILPGDPFQQLDQSRRRPAGGDGRRQGPSRQPAPASGHLRRTRWRSQFGGLLPQGRSGLRELFAVPRAHRPAWPRRRSWSGKRAGRGETPIVAIQWSVPVWMWPLLLVVAAGAVVWTVVVYGTHATAAGSRGCVGC